MTFAHYARDGLSYCQQDVETALSKGAVKYILKSKHEPKEVADMVEEIVTAYTRNDIP